MKRIVIFLSFVAVLGFASVASARPLSEKRATPIRHPAKPNATPRALWVKVVGIQARCLQAKLNATVIEDLHNGVLYASIPDPQYAEWTTTEWWVGSDGRLRGSTESYVRVQQIPAIEHCMNKAMGL